MLALGAEIWIMTCEPETSRNTDQGKSTPKPHRLIFLSSLQVLCTSSVTCLSLAVYPVFKVGKEYLDLSISPWILVYAAHLSCPVFTFVRHWRTDYKVRREATSLDAAFVPHVPESLFTVSRKVLSSFDSFPSPMFT